MLSARLIWYLSSVWLVLVGGNKVIAEKEIVKTLDGVEELLRTEALLVEKLQLYVTSMTTQLEMLKSKVAEIQKQHSAAANNVEKYFSNRVNVYLLLQRLQKIWRFYEYTIRNEVAPQALLYVIGFARAHLKFVSEEDAKSSALAMERLKDSHQMDVSQIVAGYNIGVKYDHSMSWKDCFHLGQELYNLKDFNHAIPWLKESYQRHGHGQSEMNENSSETVKILELMALSHSAIGDFQSAMDPVDKLLQLQPDREYVIGLKKHLVSMIQKGNGPSDDKLLRRNTHEYRTYQRICRGEVEPEPWKERELRCKFFHRDVPYRLLMPFKMEEVNLDPYVVVFHDLMSDEEMESIKEMAKPTLTRSAVNDANNDRQTTSLIRTSQNTWIKYDTLPATKSLRQRVGDITGLDTEACEDLQVANYGIDGYYEPHYDCFFREKDYKLNAGNRMATAIFYLSDVEQGGATSFIFLKRAIQPEKGSMMLWYNLYKSEKPDFRTLHAACPVLKGEKWVANVWIGSRAQMFKRPCGLYPDHLGSLQ